MGRRVREVDPFSPRRVAGGELGPVFNRLPVEKTIHQLLNEAARTQLLDESPSGERRIRGISDCC